jgi:hypothetical protein
LYAEFPFKNWTLQPGVDSVTLTIDGQFNHVTILIGENGCKAVGVEGVTGTYSSSMLLEKLSKVGLSFIGPLDIIATGLPGKVPNYAYILGFGNRSKLCRRNRTSCSISKFPKISF